MQSIINLTGRAVTVDRRMLLPNGPAATVAFQDQQGGEFDGIPLMERTPGIVKGLPAETPDKDGDVLYLVDSAIQQCLPSRRDLVSFEDGRHGPIIYQLRHGQTGSDC